LEPFIGRYRFSSNQLASIFLENDDLFIKYPTSPKEQIFKIGDNVYVRKEREKLIRFEENIADGKKYLVFVDEGERDSVLYQHPLMMADEKIPYEWVEAGDYENALAAYREAWKKNPEDPDFSESQINRIGYQLLENGAMVKAIDVFKINVALYPTSFNVYDSLGEAYLRSGDKDRAILNYQKSLALNPDNEGGKKALTELGISVN
jgi:tetratricopeptide (TPR) repeat protein